jgi:hypothetical protein
LGRGRVGRGFVARFFGAVDPFEDGGEVALQSHVVFAARLAGHDDDAVNDLANGLSGFKGVVGLSRSILRR